MTVPTRRAVLGGLAFAGVTAALRSTGWIVETTAQEASPVASPGAVTGPVVLLVLYGPPTDPSAFEAYYFSTHVPLASQIPFLAQVVTGRVLGTPQGDAAPYYRVAELHAANLSDLEAALASPEGQAALADLANFATGGVTALIVGDRVVVLGGDQPYGTPTA